MGSAVYLIDKQQKQELNLGAHNAKSCTQAVVIRIFNIMKCSSIAVMIKFKDTGHGIIKSCYVDATVKKTNAGGKVF